MLLKKSQKVEIKQEKDKCKYLGKRLNCFLFYFLYLEQNWSSARLRNSEKHSLYQAYGNADLH